ncbi:MAG: Maf family protein, partial [Nanoarchaeota archaeon]|nr:Maf family protein [Nanoarchaeota archaeon]
MRKIILASGSPRRKALLNQLIGADFEVVESTYEEDNTQAIPPKELVMKHSIEKGKDVATRCKEGIVISADTLVVLDNGVLGKPKTAERARETLEKISGREIHVISGITLIDID